MPLLRTKLYIPTTPPDHVSRPRLTQILVRALGLPMTLVTAPAGYGKSTLVSGWLPQAGIPAAWLSLELADSDGFRFLKYFIAAVRTVEPKACPATWNALGMRELSDPKAVFTLLLNELDEIANPILLVLDDYHFISDRDVHEFMTMFVTNRPRHLHLIMLTRHDPPLPLQALRIGGGLADIRQADLGFTNPEAIDFFGKSVQISVADTAVEELMTRTHGWPAAMRLLALRLGQRGDVDSVLRALRADNRHLQDYLSTEILDNIEPWFRRGLLATCILDSFCAASCEAVAGGEFEGRAFIDRLESTGLFYVPLDDDQRWYRYHHLFQSMLRRTLELRYSSEEIAAYHDKAGRWYRDEGLTEIAARHFLAAGNPAKAAQTISNHLPCIMEQEYFSDVRRLIKLLPRETVAGEPELLLAEAWLLVGFPEMFERLRQVRFLLAEKAEAGPAFDRAQAGYRALHSLWHYVMADGQGALESAEEALALLGPESPSYRSFAVIIQALSLQMLGRIDEGYQGLDTELAGSLAQQSPMYRARVLVSGCFVSWIDGDLNRLQRVGAQYLELGQRHGLPESIDHANYFLGIAAYMHNDLAEARLKLEAVVQAPTVSNGHNYAHASFALALTYQAAGDAKRASAAVAAIHHYAVKNQVAGMLDIIEALRAEMALREGQLEPACRWAESVLPMTSMVKYRFYLPELTLARAYMAADFPVERHRAGSILDEVQRSCEETFNRRLLLETLVLQGVRYQLAGDGAAALEALARALSLAAPGEILRPFLDAGLPVLDLLVSLNPTSPKDQIFLQQVLEACRLETINASKSIADRAPAAKVPRFAPDAKGAADLIEVLTSREGEILVLLARRLSNREIGERLFISPATVKRHSINLYAKLEVHNRRAAVSRAVSLGLISES